MAHRDRRPGGDFPVDGVAALTARLRARYPFLTAYWAGRLIRAYGTEAEVMLGAASTAADLGLDFGATLTEAEVRWLVSREFARSGADILWRRGKLGLRVSAEQAAALDAFVGTLMEQTGAMIPAA